MPRRYEEENETGLASWTRFYKAQCQIQLFGISYEDQAMGHKDMKELERLFRDAVNAFYDRQIAPKHQLQVDRARFYEQWLGEEADDLDENTAWGGGFYNGLNFRVDYVCRDCDSSLQDMYTNPTPFSWVATRLHWLLLVSRRKYFEAVTCLKVTCDGLEIQQSQQCSEQGMDESWGFGIEPVLNAAYPDSCCAPRNNPQFDCMTAKARGDWCQVGDEARCESECQGIWVDPSNPPTCNGWYKSCSNSSECCEGSECIGTEVKLCEPVSTNH